MADIANHLGVSIVTVSKALAVKDGVSEELRNQITQTAEDMGYKIKKKNPIDKKTQKIGILIQQRYFSKGQSFYWNLYERVFFHLNESGDIGILEIVSDQEQQQALFPKLMQTEKIDGFILMGEFSAAYRQQLLKSGVPFVGLDTFDADFPYDTVISDGYYGMYIVTKYLLKNGHRNISFVGTVGATASITDRFYGYCRAMLEAGVVVSESNVISDRGEDGILNISLNDIKEMPTAFACNCDSSAYYLINKLMAMGYNIPEDISVVGFDNFKFPDIVSYNITTYAADLNQMAAAAVQQIKQRIEKPAQEFRHIIVSGKMIQGDSVKDISQ
ncbi:MAG: LacI family DNA-binding transcriptional regulator [Ruminococcus sp.]